MNDLAPHAHRTGRKGDGLSGDSIVQTLVAIGEPHLPPKGEPSSAKASLARLSA